MLNSEHVLIDIYEHFQKASYRNRCEVLSPDGVLVLSVPMARGRGQRRRMKDIRIFNGENWQSKHWNSLCSCYRSSPYFEFYEDRLYPFFHEKFDRLIDLNLQAHKFVLDLLKEDLNWQETEKYLGGDAEEIDDARSSILPSRTKTKFRTGYQTPQYIQVFGDRNGFQENLSILDLLFAEGPRAASVLKAAFPKPSLESLSKPE